MEIELRNYITGNVINTEEVDNINPTTLKKVDLHEYNERFAYEIAAVDQWLNCMDSSSRNYVLNILKLQNK